jgi:hypothetical protein
MTAIESSKVSPKVMEFIRKYFQDVPENLTAKEAIEYGGAVCCRALER